MSDNGSELRSVAWAQVFPFLRLFKTFKLAIHAGRLALALCCVIACYFGGRVLDRVWLGAGRGVLVAPDARLTEVDAYASRSSADFKAWKPLVQQARQDALAAAAVELGRARSVDDARGQLATRPAGELTRSTEHEKDVSAALQAIEQRLNVGLTTLKNDKNLSAPERGRRRDTLLRFADQLRLILAGHEPEGFAALADPVAAFQQWAGPPATQPTDQSNLLAKTVRAQQALNQVARSKPAGPFISLLSYETQCFAGAVRGVCTFRWGFAGAASDSQPSLLGSIVSAGRGVAWVVTQHPWFALCYAILHFIVFAFFGGAICRHAAVQAARDETISLGEALKFAREKYAGLVLAPVVPAGIFLLVAVVMWVGGLVAAIPWIGELAAGVLYGLALLGGFALAMILIATVLGLHLMWPTIAVEGSDAFDAVTHAVGYIGQRAWNAGFYTLLLLLYGGVSFVLVRLIGVVLLKLTHVLTNAGISFFGCWSSAHTSTFSKLDAMWHMPAWGDLSLLPATGGVPFWGTFRNAPLDGTESVAAFLIACWVFLVVGLVGAFVVSFFFCGSTQMYLLLRRDVDAVDYDEIFYEETSEEPAAAAAPEPAPAPPADTGASATSPPVVEPPPGPETESPPGPGPAPT